MGTLLAPSCSPTILLSYQRHTVAEFSSSQLPHKERCYNICTENCTKWAVVPGCLKRMQGKWVNEAKLRKVGCDCRACNSKWVSQNVSWFVRQRRPNGQLRRQGGDCSKRAEKILVGRVVGRDYVREVFELGDGQLRTFHALPSGLRMEVIEQRGNSEDEKCPIVFIHGSFHAAWCWAVHWLPYFAGQGHDCFALSLLGQGESDVPPQRAAGTLESHARDISHFIRHKVQVPPVLVGHSFGGLVVQQYLSRVSDVKLEGYAASVQEGWEQPYTNLAAAVLACSVPPTGNGGLMQRYIMTKPLDSVKVTLSLAAKMFAYNLTLCQETFFSPDIPSSLLERYQKLLKCSSHIPLFNLRELNASLPVSQPQSYLPPVLVLGAENDFVVDKQGLHETASFYGTQLVVVQGIAHDLMLDTTWEMAAQMLALWIRNVGL